MSRINLHELAKSAREGQSDQRKQYMAGVAESVYRNPRHYGFRNDDEVGEAFCHYWSRIEAFPDHYIDTGTSFEAYLTSSLRYMALSIRRTLAKEFDKQAVCFEEQFRSSATGCSAVSWSWSECGEPWTLRETARYADVAVPLPEDKPDSVCAKAFRTRVIYLCIKCACLLNDGRLLEVSKLTGVPPAVMLRWIHAARVELSHRSLRAMARRRGRDSAWVRMGVNRRRLSREIDPEKRQSLASRIDKDHGVYTRACQVIQHSRSMLPNSQVAGILGVSKSTVDSGVARMLRKYLPLYADEDG